MKKSTYIIIGGVVFLAVFTFMFPLIFFTDKGGPTLTLAGDETSISLSDIDGIELKVDANFHTHSWNERPYLEVREDSTLASPRMTMDSNWAANMVVNHTGTKLSITVDMKNLSRGGASVYIDSAAMCCGVLEVPAMERFSIDSEDFGVNCSGIHLASLHLGQIRSVNLTDCRIDSVSVEDHRESYGPNSIFGTYGETVVGNMETHLMEMIIQADETGRIEVLNVAPTSSNYRLNLSSANIDTLRYDASGFRYPNSSISIELGRPIKSLE